VDLNKTAGATFFKSDVPFAYQESYEAVDHCFSFWIAYVRRTAVLAVNCLKSAPFWMSKLSEYIGWLPLKSLLIPGTHDSLKIGKFKGYYANSLSKRWTYRQEESVWNQLVMGVRFLHVNLLSSMDGVDSLLEKFSEEPNKKLAIKELKGALGTLVK